MKKLILLLLSIFAMTNYARAESPVVLTVSAASSLTNAFKEIAPVFEQQNKTIKIQFNFAASGQLLQQIAKGAPVDVLASADQETMDMAQDKSLIDVGSRRNFTANTLVLVVPKNAKQVPVGLSDLLKNNYQRVVIGLPASVPVGRYTQDVLEKHHLWQMLEPKVIGAQNVRQALDYVARGEVEAGFVYATDALISPQVQVAFTVPTDKKILYPIAMVRTSAHEKEVRQFLAFMNGALAQAILSKYGFGKP
jgi:molybdate transport system substrate-binding protein